jgi:general secretion pathway protein F
VVEGANFTTALAAYPRLFSPLYVNMVRAGETSGTLEIVLERLAEISERQQELKTRIRAALAYPLFMSLIGTVVLFLLMIFIVPNITSIFADMNQTLPAPTRFLIAVSAFFKHYWWLMAAAVAVAAVILRRLEKTDRGEYLFHRFTLRLPMIGMLIRKLAVARFARTLGSLLENGVPLLNSLDIVRNITGNRLIAEAIESAAVEVGRGQPLARSLEPDGVFPDLSIQMIQVGEQSGNLEEMLKKIADVYETEVESRVLAMTSLLEPVMILVMGVVVGFIVLSICLPIFEMNQLVK